MCAATSRHRNPDGTERDHRCSQEATHDGGLCVYHHKVKAGLMDPMYFDGPGFKEDTGLRFVIDGEGATISHRGQTK